MAWTEESLHHSDDVRSETESELAFRLVNSNKPGSLLYVFGLMLGGKDERSNESKKK